MPVRLPFGEHRRQLKCRKGVKSVKKDSGKALTPSEVGRWFGVDPKTVSRWARDGQLACFKTLGGHRRFKESDVKALYERRQVAAASSPAA